jgi:hypothetical protein
VLLKSDEKRRCDAQARQNELAGRCAGIAACPAQRSSSIWPEWMMTTAPAPIRILVSGGYNICFTCRPFSAEQNFEDFNRWQTLTLVYEELAVLVHKENL